MLWTGPRTQYFFGAGDSVNNHFNASENDYTEAPEHQGMEKSDYRPTEYFCLAECDFHHYSEAFYKIPDKKSFSGEPKITYYSAL